MTAEEAIELLKKIISIPSLSREEDKVADMMEELWREEGYMPMRKGNNVWVKSHHWNDSKPIILLDAHIDTVKPNPSWTMDPFKPEVIDSKLYGLGSNDTGGCVVSMHAVFLALDEKEQAYNMICLNTAQEENTGVDGMKSLVEVFERVDFAIIGEPTLMHPAIAEKGLMVLDCVAHGKSGHAARKEGVNAIYKAMDDIEWFRSYRFEKESSLLGPVKMTVTGINAGTLHNVVPAECTYMVDVRINEYYSNREVYDIICQHVNSEVKARSFTINSSHTPENHPFVQRCIAKGRVPYGSPTTSNQAAIPFTSLKIGPGDSARSHTANEYIGLDEIREGIALYYELLDGLNL